MAKAKSVPAPKKPKCRRKKLCGRSTLPRKALLANKIDLAIRRVDEYMALYQDLKNRGKKVFSTYGAALFFAALERERMAPVLKAALAAISPLAKEIEGAGLDSTAVLRLRHYLGVSGGIARAYGEWPDIKANLQRAAIRIRKSAEDPAVRRPTKGGRQADLHEHSLGTRLVDHFLCRDKDEWKCYGTPLRWKKPGDRKCFEMLLQSPNKWTTRQQHKESDLADSTIKSAISRIRVTLWDVLKKQPKCKDMSKTQGREHIIAKILPKNKTDSGRARYRLCVEAHDAGFRLITPPGNSRQRQGCQA